MNALTLAEDPENSDAGNAYEGLFLAALHAAKEAGASDLHIEPTRSGVLLRMRVFGEMQPPWKEFDCSHRQSFINQVKASTGLLIGVSGKPQDGRLALPDLELDLRVNLLPTLYGEKIVLRLLDRTRRFELDELGLGLEVTGAIKRALRSRDGVVLISGPTGSGKTTTLYTMLCALDRAATNIITLEDPIEYSIDGINQVAIGRKLTFAAALRAVLRQDPDVILVGEIRDRETAELAFQAASTGHLVLSTIHANSAVEVTTRLTGLGVEPYLIESNLRFSAAQRLARRLCANCSCPAPKGVEDLFRREADELGLDGLPDDIDLRIQGSGCKDCLGGLTGRIPLIEFLDDAAIAAGFKSRALKCSKTIGQTFVGAAVLGQVDCREVTAYA